MAGLRRTVSASLLVAALLPASAAAEVVQIADGVRIEERASNAATLYGYNGANVFVPAGAMLGVRDIQGGFYDPARPSMLNLDIGTGNPQHPGVLNLGADVSRMVRIQNGAHRTVLATRAYGVTILGKLTVCRAGRCFDPLARLRSLAARVRKLERRVH